MRFGMVGITTQMCRTCLATWHINNTPRHRHDCTDVKEGEKKSLKCPDRGACHHQCEDNGGKCFRVRTCSPLSGEFPGDKWPSKVKEEHGRQES